jgi:hypothetical protein
MDRGETPATFLLRTPEPVDWRRVQLTAVLEEVVGGGYNHRFAVRIIPSPDGCAAVLLLLAEGIPVRTPRGRYALRIVFYHRLGMLPSLVDTANPGTINSIFTLTFEQTLGRSWHA